MRDESLVRYFVAQAEVLRDLLRLVTAARAGAGKSAGVDTVFVFNLFLFLI